MAATLSFYDNWREAINDAALRSATIKGTLHTSSYTFSSAHSVYADLTNELSTANGYTNGGQALAGVVWDHAGATATFDANDLEWTASGGSIVHRRLVLRVVGTFNSQVDPLILSVLSDNTPADVTVTTGNVLRFAWNASGIFTVT
jgi:hypothetical protein